MCVICEDFSHSLKPFGILIFITHGAKSVLKAFHQLSNGKRHVMPSTDRRLELKAKDIDGSDRLTASCVLINLASPGVSQTSVYAKGLKKQMSLWQTC